jgi:hypothetical protein
MFLVDLQAQIRYKRLTQTGNILDRIEDYYFSNIKKLVGLMCRLPASPPKKYNLLLLQQVFLFALSQYLIN